MKLQIARNTESIYSGQSGETADCQKTEPIYSGQFGETADCQQDRVNLLSPYSEKSGHERPTLVRLHIVIQPIVVLIRRCVRVPPIGQQK